MSEFEFYRETNLKEVELNGRRVKIPEEWEVKKIKDAGRVVTGKTPPTKKKELWNGDIPFITPADFRGTPYVYHTERRVTKEWAEVSKVLLPPKTVLVVCIGSIGEVALTFTESVTNQQINAIIPFDNVDPEFIYYSMKLYGPMLKTWAGTVAMPIVKKSLFEKFQIPLPPLEEQKKIAEILRTIDEAIQAVDESIAKLERLKRGAMEELLTRGIGHTRFKEVELNGRRMKIPEEWKIEKLGALLLLLRNGLTKRQNKLGNGYPVTRIETIANGCINPDNVGYVENVTPIEIEKYRLIPGDILFSHINSLEHIGKTAIYEGKPKLLLHGMNLLLIRANPTKIYPYYLLMILRFYRAKSLFRNIAKKAVNQASINQTELKKLEIPLPPLSEQKKIAEILRTIDEAIETKRQKKEKLERMKRAVMEKLLTGEIRIR